jgi:transposase
MGMDNASWHNSKITKTIDNIVPLFQPAHSPEVNPAEHIWHYISESGNFKNSTFNSMEEVEDNLCRAVKELLSDKSSVKSITGFDWMLKAIQGDIYDNRLV